MMQSCSLAVGMGLAAVLPVAGQAQVASATYTQPTTRHDHGVLGDAVEWGALQLQLVDGRVVTHVLPADLVFEDTAPRLADLDGDGAPEVIVVESAQTQGARLAVWGAAGRITATPHIGRRNRWLAPVGAADLDGDGRIEIAFVDRPHLARVLRVWRYAAGALTEVASADGVSNHQIGWDFIAGGIQDCGQGPEMVVASADWRRIVGAQLRNGRIALRDLGAYDGPASVTCPR